MVYELLVLEHFLILEWGLKIFGWDFFLILKQKSCLNIAIKQSHFQHTLRGCSLYIQTVVSTLLIRSPMCGEHLKPCWAVCVIRNCFSWQREVIVRPSSEGHVSGAVWHCRTIPKLDSLMGQTQPCMDWNFVKDTWQAVVSTLEALSYYVQ